MWGVNAKQIDWKSVHLVRKYFMQNTARQNVGKKDKQQYWQYTLAGMTTKETEQSQGFHNWGTEGVLPPAENLLIHPPWKNLPPNSYSPTWG